MLQYIIEVSLQNRTVNIQPYITYRYMAVPKRKHSLTTLHGMTAHDSSIEHDMT